MPNPNVETAFAISADRHLPPQMVIEQAKAFAESGVIDGVLLADQLTNFIPRQLWSVENTPMAELMADPDSHPDVFVMAAYILAHAPNLHMTLSTDSVRRPPAELITTMLTLANLSGGNFNLQIGTGEIKQCKPFGHKRSQGLNRLEDLLEIYQRMMASDGPIDYQGKHWSMENATIGQAKALKPRLWALGGGPRLIDYAVRYMDGLAITCPPVMPNAKIFGDARKTLLKQVAEQGREPGSFKLGIWFAVLLVDNQAQLEKALKNPMVKWMSGMFGRIDASQWKEAGLESPVPEDWNYFSKFLPYDTDDAFIDEVLAKTTDEHVRQCWLAGTPEEVAAMIQPYIEAGADWVCPMDYMPLVMSPEEAAGGTQRAIDLCRHIRALQQ